MESRERIVPGLRRERWAAVKSAVLVIDQGTTSSRSIVFDSGGAPVSIAQEEIPQIFPQPGWVEHDPESLWRTVLVTAREAMRRAACEPAEIAAIGITNQRETTLIWERSTGRPIANAIVWQDRRTAETCASLKAGGCEKQVSETTGPRARSLFFRDQDRLAHRRRSRGAPGCGARRARLRHRRQLPALAPDGWCGACDRRHQRVPNAPLRHPQRRVGR